MTSAKNAGTNCAALTVNNKTEYWGNNYTYDAWGNLLGKMVTQCGAENLGLTADVHNWVHGPGTDYQYDAAGNMTYDATANLNYIFDQENRITGAGGYSYTYDADGERVKKSNSTTGTLYWYMTPGIVAESDLTGTLKSEYVFFNGERVARKDFSGSTTSVAYYFSDHLKTASVITDSAGNIKADSDYYPWGGELQFVNNDSNHYKFTSKERDSETGLDYFGARYYSNGLGRWVSADWSATPVPVPYANFGDPQSLNLYGYVGGNPASRTDRNGHQQSDCICQLIQHAWSAVQENNTQLYMGVTELIFHGYVAAHNFFSGNKPVPPPPPAAAVPSQKVEPSTATGAVPGTQTKTDAKPGTLGKPDHRATVKAETDRISGKSEVKIPTPAGSKDYRRADAVGTNPETGAPEIVQVYRPTPAGNMPKREVDAARDIEEATGVKPTMVPVRPVPGKQDGVPK